MSGRANVKYVLTLEVDEPELLDGLPGEIELRRAIEDAAGDEVDRGLTVDVQRVE